MLGTAPLRAAHWPLDPERTRALISLRRLGVASFTGEFRRVHGTLRTDHNNALRELSLSVDAHSLDTRDEQRDEHLRNLQIFGSDDNPLLTFKSTWSYEKGHGREGVQGALHMHGQSHIVELLASEPATSIDPDGQRWYHVLVTGTIDRRRWGVQVHPLLEVGGVLLGHEVHVELHLYAKIPAQD